MSQCPSMVDILTDIPEKERSRKRSKLVKLGLRTSVCQCQTLPTVLLSDVKAYKSLSVLNHFCT